MSNKTARAQPRCRSGKAPGRPSPQRPERCAVRGEKAALALLGGGRQAGPRGGREWRNLTGPSPRGAPAQRGHTVINVPERVETAGGVGGNPTTVCFFYSPRFNSGFAFWRWQGRGEWSGPFNWILFGRRDFFKTVRLKNLKRTVRGLGQ